MGKLKGGILGPISGKVGNVVGTVVGGQNVLKLMPSGYNDLGSQAQLDQRSAFTNTVEWYKKLAAVAILGFKERLAIHSAYNVFVKENVGTGIITSTPTWNSLKLAKGSLINPNLSMHTTDNIATMEFNWDDDSDGSAKLATDIVVCVIIEPLSGTVIVDNTTATRADETAVIAIPTAMQTKTLQSYSFVLRADGKKASNSVRTGSGIPGSDLAGSVQ